jgi:hypothetical protein
MPLKPGPKNLITDVPGLLSAKRMTMRCAPA